MPPPAEKIQLTSMEPLHQDMAEPACDGELEAKSSEITMCDTITANSCTYPSFVKTIRSFNMRTLGQFRLEIPATFVKEHGHNFQATVVLRGPSGRLTPVRLRIQSYAIQDRVHFGGAGWRVFVLENGLKVGHQLLFSLISRSTFAVRHLDSASAATVKKPKKPSVGQNYRIVQTSNIANSTCLGLKLPPNVSEMSTRPSGKSLGKIKNDVVYANGTLRVKPEVESLVENLHCPHFVTRIWKSNVRESVPHKFLEKYGAYFTKKVNVFQGPSGRMVELCFSGSRMPRFTTGWRTFHKENGIRLGDVLLFSLRAPACWLVQVVDSHSRESIMNGEELCNRSDLK